ncbi:DUF3466 family protein [Paraglaciecola arctica]|uniref:DUF3466 family protein n=1 Tax=Paraglaciecola arctica BSs20135 TaxID=493475 RepID=K6ZCJ8_9ALTE|nr:DUF3466 family protein [Paraglaciecola arctica]GAC21155.1 hypothetical protein GARC_4213 [Paraglaciecola arctica BSs20135]
MKKAIIAGNFTLSLLAISQVNAAQYKVIELPVAELGSSTFPVAINNVGETVVNMELQYSPPIDTSLINFESAIVIAGLENIDGVRGGDLSDFDYSWIYSYVSTYSEDQQFQQIASLNSYLATETYSEILRGFDTIDPNTDGYRNSVTTQVRSINDFGYTVGKSQDGFYTLTYLNEDFYDLTYVLNDFYSRGFAQVDGDITELPPPDVTAGGLSDAYDINTSNQVVGYGTTEFVSDTYSTEVESCGDPSERGDVPEKSCLRSLSISLMSNVASVAQQRGLIWQLDERGNLIDTYTLGMLIEPDDASTAVFTSTAVAINDYGIAVGVSPSYYQDTTTLTTAAAIYIGDQVTTINEDEDVYTSTASDINNDGLVVGYITKDVNGTTRNKFFVHDIEADLTTYPDDFFDGSSSEATSINNEGFVVGYGESDYSLTTRRTEGFVYDYKNDIFQGLNTLIECNSEYDIVQANGINDDNEIVATALVSKPQKNIRGEIVLDELGGQTEVDTVVAVKLVPILGGSIDNCDVYEEEQVRQGASMPLVLNLGLFLLCLIRLRTTKKD